MSRLLLLLVALLTSACAASTTPDTDDDSSQPKLDGGKKVPPSDAAFGARSDTGSNIEIDGGSAGCVPGEVVGTVHISNTCYLDCLNACMACDSPTGDASCGPFNHPGHYPYCGVMSFIVCPEGSSAERTYMDTATQYFPGTQHYQNETYSCICDDIDSGTPQ